MMRCGVLEQVVATPSFKSGAPEIFDVRVVPGYRYPVVSRPYADVDETETIWLAPAPRPTADVAGQPGP